LRDPVTCGGATTGTGWRCHRQRTAAGIQLGGFPLRVIGIEDLIVSKRKLGRPKDQRVALELEAVLKRLKQP
jgi:predicted nucleotidyltransferase